MRAHRLALMVLAVVGSNVCLHQFAAAADMPIKAARYPAGIAYSYNWSGIYVGINGGYGWGRSNWSDTNDFGAHTIRGGFVGGTIGYNWQSGPWVLGLEADVDWANLKGNHVDQFLSDLHTKVTALGTLTGRVGYAWNQALLYAKGGAAWARFKYDDFDLTAGGALNGTNSTTRWGWTIGGGLEYGFAPKWSAKVEYNYLDFGTERLTFCCGIGGTFQQTLKDHIHLLKLGVNYRFSP